MSTSRKHREFGCQMSVQRQNAAGVVLGKFPSRALSKPERPILAPRRGARIPRPNHMLKKLIADRRGSQMVEYILLVGVVALLAIVAFRKFGWTVREKTDQQTEAVMQDDKDD